VELEYFSLFFGILLLDWFLFHDYTLKVFSFKPLVNSFIEQTSKPAGGVCCVLGKKKVGMVRCS
jgi:hypothetical protein